MIYACPVCRLDVELSQDQYVCSKGHMFPVHIGIPDFRIFDPPYVSRDEEKPRVKLLLENYHSMSFLELVSFHLREVAPSDEPETLVQHHIGYRSAAIKRGADRMVQLYRLLGTLDITLELKSRALDLGCGTGGHLVALGQEFEQVLGIDISFEELILAKKNLEEHGLVNVTLVCACAESLPFRDTSFDFCNAAAVIEHVRNHEEFVEETHRVLAANGILSFNSPNRFTIFKEPHVHVWGVGFLPERFASAYVSLVRGIPYEGKDPLSFLELNRLLKETYKQDYRIFTIPGTNANMSESGSSKAGRIYRTLNKIPLLDKLMRLIESLFLPVFEVIALRKADDSAPVR